MLDSLAAQGFRQLQCELEALDLNCTANYEELGAQILEEANDTTTKFENDTEVMKKDRPLAVSAQARMREIVEGEPAMREIGAGCECSKAAPFAYFRGSNVRVVVLPQDAPLAQAYPNGKVYITAGLVDTTLPYAAKNDVQVIGALAHELVHLRDGHVFLQWAFLHGRNKQNVKLVASKLSGFLSLASRVSPVSIPLPNYHYESSIRFGDVSRFEQSFEYEADLGAIRALERLGHNPKEYLHFLENLSAYRAKYRPEEKAPYGWIDGRLTCLARLLAAPKGGGERAKSQAEDAYMTCAAEHVARSRPPS